MVKPPGGFTIPELLVSLAIITVMTGLALANFRGGEKAAELRFAAEILVQQLRDFQTSALGGRLVEVCIGGADDGRVCGAQKSPTVGCVGGVCQKRVPAGYGILFDSGSNLFTPFYDTDGDAEYDLGEELGTRSFVSTGTVKVSETNVGVSATAVFTAPNGRLRFTPAPASEILELTLQHATSGQERHVKLYRVTGKIEHD